MELKVYDGEKFDRSKTWFIIFAFVILLVVILSILSKNIVWWIIVLVVAGGYIYYITKTNETTKIITWKQALQIWKAVFPYDSLSWFVLEYHTEKKKIHNIVIIDNKKVYRIYTIKDTNIFTKKLAKNKSFNSSTLNWKIKTIDRITIDSDIMNKICV